MIKKTIQLFVSKAGKSYQIDTQIPDIMLLEMLFSRAFMLMRGLLFLRKKVFLGSNCNIKNKKNIQFGKSCTIEKDTRIDGYASSKIVFGDACKIGAYSHITCTSHLSKYGIGLQIGNHSAIGDFAHFGASGGIKIGNDVIMGSYVSFHSENHIFADVTQPIRNQGVTSKGIVLGNNIWVGAKVTFLDGTILGNNCVVAAGAVVSGIFPDNVIIGGVPAKILKQLG